MSTLSQEELQRYSRHFPVIGMDGQEKLKNSKVLCVGGGGLGCPALQYLAASGVGTLAIMDEDHIELSNLQRQILFSEKDIGRNKAVVIMERLQALNSHIHWDVYQQFLTATNAHAIINQYDVVLDASDNFSTRYVLNQACRALKKPLVSASVFHFEAQLSVFNLEQGPCYQCLYPAPPPEDLSPNCAVSGVLGVLPGVAGCLQAMEAIKVLIEAPGILSGTLLSMDLLTMQFKRFSISKQDCSKHPLINTIVSNKCDSSAQYTEISPAELQHLLTLDSKSIQLLDVRESFEREICSIGGVHIPLTTLTRENAKHLLSEERPVVVYCKSGIRSASACSLLNNAGFKAINLKGGILSWLKEIDHRV